MWETYSIWNYFEMMVCYCRRVKYTGVELAKRGDLINLQEKSFKTFSSIQYIV